MRSRRWHRIAELALDGDELRELAAAVRAVCQAPQDPVAHEGLRTLTDSRALHDQVVPLLSVEAREQTDPVVLAALRDEVRHVCARIDRPSERLAVLEDRVTREPENAEHIERLAWTYYLVGAWVQAAQTLERLAPHVAADQALVILRAAGRLYRNSRSNDRALIAYRAVALRKPTDVVALMALGDLMLAPPTTLDARFDPQVPPAAPRTATKSRVVPVDAATSSLALTNRQSAVDLHDLFSTLGDDEVEASLAFAFGDEHAEVEAPPQPARNPTRKTQERDGLLRPPAQPSQSIALPPPEGHTVIDFDEIADQPDDDDQPSDGPRTPRPLT